MLLKISSFSLNTWKINKEKEVLKKALYDLSKCEIVTPLEVYNLFHSHDIGVDPIMLCNHLCKISASFVKISNDAIVLLLAAIDDQNQNNVDISSIHHNLGKSVSLVLSSTELIPDNILSNEETLERGQKVFIQFADFLFEKQLSLLDLIHHKIFSKVIDGQEHQLIKIRHLYSILENSGFHTSYYDKLSFEKLVKPILRDVFDIETLRYQKLF